MEKKSYEIGAAWRKESKAGNQYISLLIGGKNAVMFHNSKKTDGSKQPDYRLYTDDEELAALLGKGDGVQPQPASQEQPTRKPMTSVDDMPF